MLLPAPVRLAATTILSTALPAPDGPAPPPCLALFTPGNTTAHTWKIDDGSDSPVAWPKPRHAELIKDEEASAVAWWTTRALPLVSRAPRAVWSMRATLTPCPHTQTRADMAPLSFSCARSLPSASSCPMPPASSSCTGTVQHENKGGLHVCVRVSLQSSQRWVRAERPSRHHVTARRNELGLALH